jgi:sugar phosphate permease
MCWGIQRLGHRTTILHGLGCTAVLCLVRFCFLLFAEDGLIATLSFFLSKMLATTTFQICYVYTAHLFSASSRGLALGSSSSAARVGGMLAPLVVVSLAESSPLLVPLVFGVTSALVVGVLYFCAGGSEDKGEVVGGGEEEGEGGSEEEEDAGDEWVGDSFFSSSDESSEGGSESDESAAIYADTSVLDASVQGSNNL